MRSEADRGIGDTVKRIAGEGEGFKRWHEAMFGIWAQPCECDGKVVEWNALYAYQPTR